MKKSDLLQVNRQLHKWLETINNKSDYTNNIFNSEEKVNTFDENSTDKMRLSRKLSEGEQKKQIVNYTRKKVYSNMQNEIVGKAVELSKIV